MKGHSQPAPPQPAPRRARNRPDQPGGREAGPRAAVGERSAAPGNASGNAVALTAQIQALRRYANVLVGHPADADDLVQETLKRALTYLEGDRQIDNLRAYLFTILHNARNDALRKRARSGTQVPIDDMPLVSEAASQADRIACNEAIQAIQRLSEEHRQLLLLVGVEGMSYRECAEILGRPIGTVMSRLNRARAALRNVLGLAGRVEIDRNS